MAEEQKKDKEQPEGEAAPKSAGRKKGLLMGGGVVGLVAVAYFAALMAVPGRDDSPPLEGPFVANLSPPEEQLSVNLSGGGSKNYLALTMKAEFVVYDEAYVAERIADPLFQAMLVDRTIMVASQKTKDELNGAIGKDVLREELRVHVDPLLFPVHVGETSKPTDPDPDSGLRPGRSSPSLRGFFHDHVLSVDAPRRTIRLDGGDPVSFEGHETDLAVAGPQAERVFLDVTSLDPAFVGDVHVGVHGTIRNIYFSKFLVQ